MNEPKPIDWDKDKLSKMNITTKHKVESAVEWLKEQISYHKGHHPSTHVLYHNYVLNKIDEAFGLKRGES